MTKKSASHQRIMAFTLVELLVVVAIVAALLVITLQLQGRLREQGQATVCVQRLRALGVALAAHAGEHRGHYPPTAGYLHQKWIQAGWTEFLQHRGYLERGQMAFCPGLDREAAGVSDLSEHHPLVAGKSFGHFTYGLRSDHPGKIPPPYPVWTGSWANFFWNGEAAAPISTLLIEAPSSSIVASDSIGIYGNARLNSYRYDAKNGSWTGVDFRHGGKANALFADGRVASLTVQEMAKLLEAEDGTAPYWTGDGFSMIR